MSDPGLGAAAGNDGPGGAATAATQVQEPRVIVVPGPEDVAATAASLVLEAEARAIARSGQFRIALAGGSTPRRLHGLLATNAQASLDCWQVFFGDERWAPPGHADLNATMARETLLRPAGIREAQVHAIDVTAGSPERAAFLYSLELRRHLPAGPGAMPVLDLVLLGLGADGHTASLFPSSSALEAAPGEIVVATWVKAHQAWRVTLTAAAINAAREVLFVVSGAGKAGALRRVLEGDGAAAPPAARIRPRQGGPVFVVDEAAAGRSGPLK